MASTIIPNKNYISRLFNPLTDQFNLIDGVTHYDFIVPTKISVATTEPLPLYTVDVLNNKLTFNTNDPVVIDGHTLVENDIVLVKDEADLNRNGDYYVYSTGPVVLARQNITYDFDKYDPNKTPDCPKFVIKINAGTVNANTCWTLTIGVNNGIENTPLSFTKVNVNEQIEMVTKQGSMSVSSDFKIYDNVLNINATPSAEVGTLIKRTVDGSDMYLGKTTFMGDVMLLDGNTRLGTEEQTGNLEINSSGTVSLNNGSASDNSWSLEINGPGVVIYGSHSSVASDGYANLSLDVIGKAKFEGDVEAFNFKSNTVESYSATLISIKRHPDISGDTESDALIIDGDSDVNRTGIYVYKDKVIYDRPIEIRDIEDGIILTSKKTADGTAGKKYRLTIEEDGTGQPSIKLTDLGI